MSIPIWTAQQDTARSWNVIAGEGEYDPIICNVWPQTTTGYDEKDLARNIAALPALIEALIRIEAAPAWGAPDRWETTPSEVRQLAREALAKARGE